MFGMEIFPAQVHDKEYVYSTGVDVSPDGDFVHMLNSDCENWILTGAMVSEA